MPGLLRGVARTAVVAGTASAVSGRVQRRQAERFADRDAEIVAQRQQAYQDQGVYQQAEAAPATGPPIEQLKELAALREQGILTDEEFATQKARLLAG